MKFKSSESISKIVIIIIIVIVISVVVIKKEFEKRELIVERPIAVPFDGSVESLVLPSYKYSINDYVYTLIKEDKVDELYDFLYEADQEMYDVTRLWLIYDLAINNQYCMTKEIDELCYVSKDEIKTSIIEMGQFGRTYNFYNTAQVESSVNGITTYNTASSDQFFQTVDYAYVISQGADADGYDEAMKASYDIAVENGYLGKYELFATDYTNELSTYQTKLEKLKNVSLEEVITNYSEYVVVIAIIERNLDIIEIDDEKHLW